MPFKIFPFLLAQDKIARIRKPKRGRNMLNRSGNTTDNLCFRYRFRDVFSRFRCCVYNGTGPLLRKHNGNMELHVSVTFQKYGNMWFRPVLVDLEIFCELPLTINIAKKKKKKKKKKYINIAIIICLSSCTKFSSFRVSKAK